MKYVIIGNSAAGTAAAVAIHGQDPQGEIVLVSKDTAFYSRCQLHLVAAGKRTGTQADFLPKDWLVKNHVTFRPGRCVLRIDPQTKTLECDNGEVMGYDRLLIATGSRSLFPPIEGLVGRNTFGLRDLADADIVRDSLVGTRHVVIIGAGLVGCELAESLVEVGHPSVTLVEMAPHPLPMQLEEETGSRLAALMRTQGVNLICGDAVTRVVRDHSGQLQQVLLKSGKTLPADLIVCAAGVRANLELPRSIGAECGRGILVDETCRTNLADIYAAGDVTECRDATLGRIMPSAIWPAARRQGRVAGVNMAGGSESLLDFTGLKAAVSLFGTSMVSIGAVSGPDPSWKRRIFRFTDSRGRQCLKVFYHDGKGVLHAAVLWGDVTNAGLYADAVATRRKLDDIAPSEVPEYRVKEANL
jgi:NAD(P)H-nitrite reductase large subunit